MGKRKEGAGRWAAVLWAAALLLGGCAAPPAVSSSAPATSSTPTAGTASEASPFVHFSIDDVLDVFSDLTVNEAVYESAFENPMLHWLRGLHQEYGAVVTLYCFYENHDATFNLNDVTERFAREFAQNSHWLRFAFHARSIGATYEEADAAAAARDYTLCTAALTRIAGGVGSIDGTVRLHWFQASRQALAAMKDEPAGVRGLLAGVNENDANYYLDEAQQRQMFSQGLWQDGGLFFTPTDLWLEDIPEADWPARLQPYANGGPACGQGALVAFTHEYMMQDEALLRRITETVQFARENGYRFCFVEEGLFGGEA